MSDLIIEFGRFNRVTPDKTLNFHGVEVTRSEVGSRDTDDMRKHGIYYTLSVKSADNADTVGAIADILAGIIGEKSRIMAVGLGNPRFAADRLGTAVLDGVAPSGRIVKVYPYVSSITGINSVEMIRAISNLIKPDVVLAVDTLSTLSAERLGKVLQITTAGIAPGSGIGANIGRVDSHALGVSVVAVGVPLVTKFGGKSYTPIEIDEIIQDVAGVISGAINLLA